MSLLLDARRKIELALEQTGVHKGGEPQPSEAMSRNNQPAQGIPAGVPLLHSDPVAVPARSTPTGTPLLHSDPVAAGKNLFAAKPAPARGGRRLGIIPVALIGGAVIAAGGGYYVWREATPSAQVLRPASKQTPAVLAITAPPANTMSSAQEAKTGAPVVLPVAQPVAAKAPPRPPVQMPPATSLQQTVSPASVQRIAEAGNTLPPIQAKHETTHRSPKDEADEAKASSAPIAQPVNIERGSRQAGVDPALLAAWQAYRNGDFDLAGQRYGEILKRDAKNRDALLGMAAVAQQQVRDDAAANYYRQMLVLDPRDPAAQAGLLSLPGLGREADTESRLKLLLAQQQQSAALHFAIGNLYAGQSRWSEAQQSYFTASNLEPDNAQLAFNLAVSLDHLGKGKIAAQHYQRALQLDNAAFPGIDRKQTQKRLDELMAAH